MKCSGERKSKPTWK